MLHTQEQLNAIWDEVRSGRQAEKADKVRALAPHGSVDILPVIVISDSLVQVMSVPIRENTARAVYARKLNGTWVELP